MTATTRLPIPYMGTKRHLADRVRGHVDALCPTGSVVDLFSGMGSVAQSLSPNWHVTTNDLLTFTTLISRARFTATSRSLSPAGMSALLRDPFRTHAHDLRRRYRLQMKAEAIALDGDHRALRRYMDGGAHVGNSAARRRAARRAARSSDPTDHYRLALLYFSAGYFSAGQAIELDALRRAIDERLTGPQREWALAAWLSAAGSVINAPGHAAQYLKATTPAAARRVQASWRRRVWSVFQDWLVDLIPVGTEAWRRGNRATSLDALSFLQSEWTQGVGVIYADPPYTKDQYSRYYHVYETLYRYDFPDSVGQGRYRSDRYSTSFCRMREVRGAFEALIGGVADLNVPLILSYPSNGLLRGSGADLEDMLRSRFSRVARSDIVTQHSTMGASSGEAKKAATESIYVCQS